MHENTLFSFGETQTLSFSLATQVCVVQIVNICFKNLIIGPHTNSEIPACKIIL